MKKSTMVYCIVSIVVFFVFAIWTAFINAENPESLWNWEFSVLLGAVVLNTSVAFTIVTRGPIFERNK